MQNNTQKPSYSDTGASQETLAILLSGGAGTRFNGKDKGLQLYRGKPMIQRVIETVEPQVDELIISANRNYQRYHDFGFEVVADYKSNDESTVYEGPIAGILAALGSLTSERRYDYLLVCPCDSPQLPVDYVQQLSDALSQSNSPAALVNDGERKQNLHCLIKRKRIVNSTLLGVFARRYYHPFSEGEPMTRRTQADWHELIEQQRESGLSAAEFCRRNSVNAKYFSLRKQKLKQAAGNFVRISSPDARPSPVAATGIKVRVVELEIPRNVVAETLTLLLDRLGR